MTENVIQADHVLAHAKSRRNRDEVLASSVCGCFYCMATFSPEEVREWASSLRKREEGERATTAICPACGIDSVIGSASGYPITEEFLKKMHQRWFERTTR